MIPKDQLLQRVTYKSAAEERDELSAFSRQEEWLGCVCVEGGGRGGGSGEGSGERCMESWIPRPAERSLRECIQTAVQHIVIRRFKQRSRSLTRD